MDLIGKNKERWLELCEQAANEQDSEKLIALAQEINRFLAEKETRLNTKDRTDRPS